MKKFPVLAADIWLVKRPRLVLQALNQIEVGGQPAHVFDLNKCLQQLTMVLAGHQRRQVDGAFAVKSIQPVADQFDNGPVMAWREPVTQNEVSRDFKSIELVSFHFR